VAIDVVTVQRQHLGKLTNICQRCLWPWGRDPVAGRMKKTWADNKKRLYPETPLRLQSQRRFFMPKMRYAF
jgi:hypothetical protein